MNKRFKSCLITPNKDGVCMGHVSDDAIREIFRTTQSFTAVILRAGPNRHLADADAVIWEHGRRSLELRLDGKLRIICLVNDESDVEGIGIMSTNLEETRRIMNEDPAIKSGVFVYEVHSTRSFPGDNLNK